MVPPGRGEGEGAHASQHKVVVEPSENSSKRAEAFSELAVALAENHPDIKQFRRKHLGDRLLTDDEARTLLDRQGGPYGTGWILKELRKLAEKLVLTYRWREGDAIWFVLTGYKPPVTPLDVSVSINQTSRFPGWPKRRIPGSSPPRYIAAVPRPADYHPSTARITVIADAWVDAREVERVFRETQRQILGGDAKPVKERTLEVVEFVAQRMREHPQESWEECNRAWNHAHPEWRYDSYRGLRQAFKRFANRLHRPYDLPNVPLPEPTPYQAYRDDWIDGRTGPS